ncbi:MAG: type IX secretion system sortase PorU [FCB group bacterium]|nr:type IX secretion system sortase PorU [FCB group bacterium]
MGKDKFPDIRIVESSAAGITLLYSPSVSGFEQPNYPAEIRLNVPFHASTGLPGSYNLPFRRHLIAIPPGSDVTLTIESVRTGTLIDVSPEKIPSSPPDVQTPDNLNISDEFISISEPFRYRRYEVVSLILKPAQFDELSNSIHFPEEIRFRINISGGQTTGHSEPNADKYSNIILNYDQAKNWAVPPERNTNSAFPTGELIRMTIYDEGIYRLGYAGMAAVFPEFTDYPLDLLSLYNNGGRELPALVYNSTEDSLIENAIYVFDQNLNNEFDAEDYILFYGTGTSNWEETSAGYYSHYINHFTNENIYWLELKQSGSPGKRMDDFSAIGSASSQVITSKARIYREEEQTIYAGPGFTGSGLNWYGDLISGFGTKSYVHDLSGVASGYYKIKVKLYSYSGLASFEVLWDNVLIDQIASGGIYTIEGDDVTENGITSLKFVNKTANSAYVDWYEIEYERYLEAEDPSDPELIFESPLGSGIAQFGSLVGFSGDAYIFKISDFKEVGMTRGNTFKDTLSPVSSVRYLAVEETAFRTPESMVAYQSPPSDFIDLRNSSNSADYLYIAHADFYDGIDPVMQIWSEQGIDVKKVDVQLIFDQFSWGQYDPAGIRNFLKYAVDNWAVPPTMVAFVGDGDYDYLNHSSDADDNWIPPYEAGGSSYDDYYAYLHQNNDPEIALGRWTVRNENEMEIVVDKIVHYVMTPEFGVWKTRFTTVGDDEFAEGGETSGWEQNHVNQSEDLAENYLPEFFNTEKIYLTAYPLAPGAGGRQKPAAADNLIESINKGSIIVNYFGHGNQSVWAHENTFGAERDLPRIDNGYKLAYFIALTCDWGYFDNPEEQSMPEELLVMPGRGAIACIGASRPTGPSSNWELASNMYNDIFEDPHNPKVVGQSLLDAKLLYSSGTINSQKYHIIGDPMIAPCSPRNGGEISGMNPDSLFEGNLTTVSGSTLKNDSLWSDFDGVVHLDVQDAANTITYQFANSSNTITYDLPGNTIFRGPFSASGGSFAADFVVPLDISPGISNGRINIYYADGESDGCAFLEGVYLGLGGTSLKDTDKPEAEVFFGDRSYQAGDPVTISPMVIVDLFDSTGINLTGSTGHDILLIADDTDEFYLTDYFEYNIDSYTGGSLEHQLDYLSPGVHSMKLRVWDSFNNVYQTEFSIEALDFDAEGEYLFDLLNYPNPFKESTTLTFKLLEPAKVKIEIYTVAGRKIRTLGPKFCYPVFVYDQFSWNGRDFEGDQVANGVYLYKVKAEFAEETVSKIGRIIVMQ